jgi:hypothetical protein
MCAQWARRGSDKHRTALSLRNCKHLVSCMAKNFPIGSACSESKRGHAEKSASANGPARAQLSGMLREEEVVPPQWCASW